jgi:hypothetical protein
MMQTYFEPDDTIFTQNSTRQDQGKEMYADKYFYQYLYMASVANLPKERKQEFDAAAHKIIQDNVTRGDLAPDCLHILMAHDEMMEHTFEGYGFLEEYRKYYPETGVLRVRKKAYSYTIMKHHSSFLYFNVDGMEVYFKIGESYCDIRNFIPQEIEVKETSSVLSADAMGWYYEPWKEKPETNDWWQMDHSKRDRLISSRLHTEAVVTELEDGLQLDFSTEGLDRLPLRLEVCIPANTILRNDCFCLQAKAGESMILRSGSVDLALGDQILEFTGGFCEHEFKGHYSGEEVNRDGYTIYCNAYTPTQRRVTIRVKR